MSGSLDNSLHGKILEVNVGLATKPRRGIGVAVGDGREADRCCRRGGES